MTVVVVGPTLIAMNGPPVWLLDIDGVVNAIAADPDRCWPASAWVRGVANCSGGDWPLLAARPVIDFIRRVHETGRAEIRWHTTWQCDASAAARALGLPNFPVQPAPEFAAQFEQRPGGSPWWKLPAAERVLEQERRALVWTDDDADAQLLYPGGRRDLYRLPTALIICPRTAVGLAPGDLRAIDAFLPRRVRRWAAALRPVAARLG